MTAPIYPPGSITPLGSYRALNGTLPELSFVGADGTKFYLQGGKSPILSCEDGIGLLEIMDMQAKPVLLDEQGARQDGITNLDTVFDPCVIKLRLELSGTTPQSMRKTWRSWVSTWNPPQVGVFTWFTQEMGHWWMPVRQNGPLPRGMQQDVSLHRRMEFEWTARGDNAFWQGPDSMSIFPGGNYPGAPQVLTDGAASGWCPVTNLGTRPAWPRFLVTGPGTFTLGNGGNVFATGNPAYASGYAPGIVGTAITPVTLGPLAAGQQALVVTMPRLRSVQLQLPAAQAGTSLYQLLNGRFTTASQVAPKQDGFPPVAQWIPVGITGGTSASQIITAITPYRTWPW